MKSKIFLYTIFYVALQFAVPAPGYSQVIWTEGFEGVTSLNCGSQSCGGYPNCLAGPPTNFTCLPSGWLTKVDLPWTASNNAGVAHNYSFPTQVKYLYFYTGPTCCGTNSWLITQGATLAAGVPYRLSFWFKTSTCSVPPCNGTFTMKVGATQTQTVIPVGPTQLFSYSGNTTWTQYQYNFTPPSTGTYYFGMQGSYSLWPNDYAYVDDISLEQLCTPPNISVTGNTSICTGDSTTLTANVISSNGPITSYQWQLNSSNIPGATSNNYAASSAGNYTVIVIDSSGCPATSSAIVITVNPLPTSSFTDSINVNTVTFTNTSQNGTSYSWDFGDGSPVDNSTNPVHTYFASGVYTVTLTVTNGCGSSSSTQTVTVIITGIEIEQNINSLNVFPNPSEQLLMVEFKVADGANVIVKIFNSLGQEVFSTEQKNSLVQHRINIDVSSFVKGHYMLQIITDQGTMNKEVIIH